MTVKRENNDTASESAQAAAAAATSWMDPQPGQAFVDFGDIPEPVVVPEGTYPMIVEDCVQEAKPAGDCWTTTLKIIGGEYDGEKVMLYLSFGDKSLDMTFQRLAILLGVPIPKTRFAYDGNAYRLIGRTVRAHLKPSEFKGRVSPKVEFLLPVGGSDEGPAPRAPQGHIF